MQSEYSGVGCLMCRAVFAGYSRLSVLPIFSICLRISGMKGAGQLTARPAQHPGFYHIWDKLCNITTHNMHTSKLNLENPLEVGSTILEGPYEDLLLVESIKSICLRIFANQSTHPL